MMSPARRLRAEAGFTLLEAMAGLAIIAAAASLTLWNVRRPSDRVLVQSAAIELAAGLKSARTSARRDGAPHALIVDAGKRLYWHDASQVPRALPSRVALAFDRDGVSGDGPGRAMFGFRPDGSSRGGSLSVSAGRARAVIVVESLTGAVRIDWGRSP